MRKNPPTLSWGGDVRLEGEASFSLFVLLVEPGGLHQNPLMVPSRHMRTKSALLSRLQAILENPDRQQLLIVSIAGLLWRPRCFSFGILKLLHLILRLPETLIKDPFGFWGELRMFTAAALMVEKRVKCYLGVHRINFTWGGESRSQASDDAARALWCVFASKWFQRFCLSSRFQFEKSDSAISHSLSFQVSHA